MPRSSRDTLLTIRDILGIDVLDYDISDDQKLLMKEREAARDSEDWARSDKIRDELKEQGIEVKDTASGTIWFRI